MQNLLQIVYDVLKQDERLISTEGELLKNKIQELANGLDENLIELLLSDETMRTRFFKQIKEFRVFDSHAFIRFINNKEFLPDSYTSFKNKIGLVDSNENFIADTNDVVLNRPYKDCVLAGGQDTEDAKRDEIFYNEILGSDQIDRLLDPKVFTNFKKYTIDGNIKVEGLRRDENGLIKENIIIKGNNLLALHSLKKQFAGEVDLIYIDPPYNTGGSGDTFAYNNRFKRSSWLTFILNRLKIAKDLLKNDGIICVTIDDFELPRLWLLLEDVFGKDNHLGTVVIRNNPKGRMTNKKFSLVHEYALFYGRSEESLIKKLPVEVEDKSHNYLKDNDGSWYLPINLRKQGVDSNAVNKKGKLLDRYFPIFYDPEENIISVTEKLKVEILPIDGNGIKRIWRRSKAVIEEMFMKGDLFIKKVNNVYQVYFKFRGGLDGQLAQSIWYDSKFSASEYGTKTLDQLLGQRELFSYPKSPEAIKQTILATVNKEDSIILDFFAGSGTTAQAILDLNRDDGGSRRFILIEQMDYINTVTVPRVHQVIKNNKIGEFVYMELMKDGQNLIDTINQMDTPKGLIKLYESIKESSFINYKIDIKTIDANISDFESLSIDDMKRFLITLLDQNALYVNYSEMNDKDSNVSSEDKALNTSFYA